MKDINLHEMNNKIENILLESVWVCRWNEAKTALCAVLTSEEATQVCRDIIKELDNAGYKIVKK